MAARKLKIYSKHRPLSSSYYGRIVPELRLCGVWLEQSGFKIGELVQITIKDQEITIKPACAEASADKPLS
jgi:toxic protein SymE